MLINSFHSAAVHETKERTKYNKYIKTIMIIITPIIIIKPSHERGNPFKRKKKKKVRPSTPYKEHRKRQITAMSLRLYNSDEPFLILQEIPSSKSPLHERIENEIARVFIGIINIVDNVFGSSNVDARSIRSVLARTRRQN